jgi:cell shape-determining protein MreC
MIGTVVKAVNRKNKGFYEITVKFSVDYNRVEYAYVIFNMLKDEEKNIKEDIENE